jgi:ABC-type transport system involved in cytochrome bd biosynthesis fused ATPase/permease subunit
MIPLAVTTTILSIPVESMGLLEFFGMMSIGITAGSLGII